MGVVGNVGDTRKWCPAVTVCCETMRTVAGGDPTGPRPEETSLSVLTNPQPRQILEIPDGHRAPAPPQSGSCDHPLLLLEPGNLASSPSMPLASPQPSGQTSREEHRGATEELASIPTDKGKLWGGVIETARPTWGVCPCPCHLSSVSDWAFFTH